MEFVCENKDAFTDKKHSHIEVLANDYFVYKETEGVGMNQTH